MACLSALPPQKARSKTLSKGNQIRFNPHRFGQKRNSARPSTLNLITNRAHHAFGTSQQLEDSQQGAHDSRHPLDRLKSQQRPCYRDSAQCLEVTKRNKPGVTTGRVMHITVLPCRPQGPIVRHKAFLHGNDRLRPVNFRAIFKAPSLASAPCLQTTPHRFL